MERLPDMNTTADNVPDDAGTAHECAVRLAQPDGLAQRTSRRAPALRLLPSRHPHRGDHPGPAPVQRRRGADEAWQGDLRSGRVPGRLRRGPAVRSHQPNPLVSPDNTALIPNRWSTPHAATPPHWGCWLSMSATRIRCRAGGSGTAVSPASFLQSAEAGEVLGLLNRYGARGERAPGRPRRQWGHGADRAGGRVLLRCPSDGDARYSKVYSSSLSHLNPLREYNAKLPDGDHVAMCCSPQQIALGKSCITHGRVWSGGDFLPRRIAA